MAAEPIGPRWAGNALLGDPQIDLGQFQSGLPVRLIATDRKSLSTCRLEEELEAVVARNRQDQFDFFPVTSGERIVGIIDLSPFNRGAEYPSGRVGDRTIQLSEDNLIGADAGILSFLRDADRQTCRLVVSGHAISGLVSLSDLQRLPVRAALFAMVTYFEMTMAAAIRREFDGELGWADRLTEQRRQKILEQIDKARADDDYVDTLLFTQFADKVAVLKASPSFTESRSWFRRDMRRAEALRNALAHANDYAATRQQAVTVCETVRSIDFWIEWFAGWAPNTSRPSAEET